MSQMLLSLLGQPTPPIITFGVARTTDGLSVVQTFPGGSALVVAATDQLVVLGGALYIAGGGGTIRVDNQAGAALGPTLTVAGAGAYLQMDIPPIILAAGDELAITTGGSGSGAIYGWGYVRPFVG